MTTLIKKNKKAQTGVKINLASVKILQASYRTYLFALFSVVLMVILIWAPFGVKRTVGLFEEWSTQRHPTSALQFIITTDPSRPFSFAPFVFAQALTPNSFAGHNWFMMLLFVLKGLIVYKLILRLMPQDRFLALLTGCLFVVYPADTGLMTFRALNIHTSITFGLLAIYLLVAQWQEPKKWRRFAIVVLQFVSLGIYEVMYGIIFSAPLLLLWNEKRLFPLSRRLIRASLLWWTLPTLLALRSAAYILTGRSLYVNSQLDAGTQNDFSLEAVLNSFTKMYERHFTAWGYAFENLSRYTPYLIYSMLAGGVVALAAWQHWQRGEAVKSDINWRRSLLLIGGGLILMGISFAPYLPTPYRRETFRVFYLSSLGAALVVATLIQWASSYLKRFGKLPAAAMTGLLILIGSYNAMSQLAFFVQASDSIQRMLAGIVTLAPRVPDNTIIVFVDESVEYQDQWHMAASTGAFISAIQFLYFDDYQHARFCTIGPERPYKYCIFRSDGILHFDEGGGVTTVPYPQAVVIRTNYRGGFELLEEIPEEYIVRGPVWKDYLYKYDPHGLIDEDGPLPERVHTFFTCWPLDECLPPLPTTAPQTEVFLDFDHILPGLGWEVPSYGRSSAWTTSPLAALNLNIAPGNSYAVQFAVAYALDPELLDSLALRVNGTNIPLEKSTLESGLILYEGLIPVEAIDANPQNTKLIFATEYMLSPKDVGLGTDDRKLGVLVDWLRITALDDTVRIDFDTAVSGDGWHLPEASQVWTSSTESTLDVWVDTQQALTAEFRITYVLSDDIINSLRFSANGVPLPLTLSRDEHEAYLYRATIPLEVLSAGDSGVVHLTFNIAETANPAALGINNDARDVGVLFDWLELHPVEQP